MEIHRIVYILNNQLNHKQCVIKVHHMPSPMNTHKRKQKHSYIHGQVHGHTPGLLSQTFYLTKKHTLTDTDTLMHILSAHTYTPLIFFHIPHLPNLHRIIPNCTFLKKKKTCISIK